MPASTPDYAERGARALYQDFATADEQLVTVELRPAIMRELLEARGWRLVMGSVLTREPVWLSPNATAYTSQSEAVQIALSADVLVGDDTPETHHRCANCGYTWWTGRES